MSSADAFTGYFIVITDSAEEELSAAMVWAGWLTETENRGLSKYVAGLSHGSPKAYFSIFAMPSFCVMAVAVVSAPDRAFFTAQVSYPGCGMYSYAPIVLAFARETPRASAAGIRYRTWSWGIPAEIAFVPNSTAKVSANPPLSAGTGVGPECMALLAQLGLV